MRGLCTAPVICWRAVWRRWWLAGQCRFLGRLVTHHLGLVPSFSCSFWRPGTHSLLLSAVQVWGRGGLQEVWMVFFQTCNRTHSDRLPVIDSPQCWRMVSCNWWCLSDFSTLKQNHWKIIWSLAFHNNSSFPLGSPFPVCIWPVYTTFVPLPVSIFFGLTELSEFCSEPRFVVVVS